MITKTKSGILIIMILLPLFLATTPEHAEAHGSSAWDFLTKVINFAVLFGGLGFLLRKPMVRFFKELGERIDRTIREAEQSRQNADTDLERMQDRLISLAQEVGEIRSTAEREGLEEKARIKEISGKEAERIKSLSEQEIGALSRHGLKEIRAFAAELACSKALKRIQSKVTQEMHSRLIDQSIDRLADIYEKSDSR